MLTAMAAFWKHFIKAETRILESFLANNMILTQEYLVDCSSLPPTYPDSELADFRHRCDLISFPIVWH